jgi:hypothetical protein
MKLAGGEKAEAANGGNLVIGAGVSTNQTTGGTALDFDGSAGAGFFVDATTNSADEAIEGHAAGATHKGVLGVNDTADGRGVQGQNMATSGAGIGVLGQTASATAIGLSGIGSGNGTGVKGVSNAPSFFSANGNGSGMGVQGNSGSGKGVFGQSTSGDGVHGTSSSGVGLRGTSPSFVGVVGISDQNIGMYGFTAAPSMPGLYAESLASSNRIAAQFNGAVQVFGNFTVMPGYAKSAAVAMPDGSDAIVYCQESPEPYFEDFGRARLVNGVAHVQLEPEFASIVKRDDYMVFPVPGGDSNGLYISQQTPQGFEVRESKGGTSSIPFTYRVVAKRRDIEGKRLERLDPKVKANIAQMRAAAAARNHPSVKVPAGGSPLVPLEPIPAMP